MYTFNTEWYTHIHVQVFKGLIPSPMHRQESTTLVDIPGSQLIGHNKMNLSCSSKTNIAMGPFKISTGTRVPWRDTAPGNYLNKKRPINCNNKQASHLLLHLLLSLTSTIKDLNHLAVPASYCIVCTHICRAMLLHLNKTA